MASTRGMIRFVAFHIALYLIPHACGQSQADDAPPIRITKVREGVEIVVDAGADQLQERQYLFRKGAGTESDERILVAEVLETSSRCLIFGDTTLEVGELLESTHTISLQGTCHCDGTPVEAVEVTAYRMPRNYADSAELLDRTLTDRNGEYEFTSLKVSELSHSRSDVILRFQKQGLVSKSEQVNIYSTEIDQQLTAETGTIAGLILQPDGTPLVGATVQAGNYRVPSLHSAETDLKGKFQINNLRRWSGRPGHSRSMRISHPDYGWTYTYFTKIPSILKHRMSQPTVIQGQVTDRVTGRPVPHAVVSAQGCTQSGWYEVRADQNGHYEMFVQPDAYNIWSAAPERIPIAVDSLPALAGQTITGANIELVEGGIIKGQLVDGNGAPIQAPNLGNAAHYGPARPRSGAAVTSTPIASDGSFRLRVAPGQNYVYLMSGSSSANVKVKDGEVVELKLANGARAPMAAQMDLRLVLEEARLEAEANQEIDGGTSTRLLLAKLDKQNKGPARFTDLWLATLKQLSDQGPEAVPELCNTLDQTDDDMTLRCIAFILRSIDDPRAVPALIRAIPKTLRKPGSDMGVEAKDEELRKFAFANDIGNAKEHYTFGRPVREILETLRSLTKHDEQDQQLFSIFRMGTEQQQVMREKLFEMHAIKWANWWTAHADQFDVAEEYRVVNLPEFEKVVQVPSLAPGQRFRSSGINSNWILQSAYDPKGKQVFWDFDTGRIAALPKAWQTERNKALPIKAIEAWAAQEGFDLMGTEVENADGERKVYALRLIGMSAWQLPEDRWKASFSDVTLEELQQEGTQVEEAFLFARKNAAMEEDGHAPFLAITREGSPLLLFLGIPVYDDSLKPGGIATGDYELNPVAFFQGRRFGFSFFEPLP